MGREARRRRGVAMMTGLLIGAVAALLLPLVPGAPGSRPAAAGLDRFASCEQLRRWYADQAAQQLPEAGRRWPPGGPGVSVPVPVPVPVPFPGAARLAREDAGIATAVGADPTGTNVQEVGVGEPDVVKTDGSLVLTVTGRTLHVVDVAGDRPRQVATLRLPVGQARELLLVGRRAVVLGVRWTLVPIPLRYGPQARMMRPVEATTSVLTVVDLNRPTAPRVLAVEELEGAILAAREHTGAVRVVLQTGPPPDEPRAGLDWLPTRTTRDAAGAAVRRGPLLECARVHHPPYAAGVGTLSVLTVRVTGAAPEVSDAVAVAADGQHVYASTDRLYVATTRGGWWSWPEGFPGGRVSTDLHAFDIIDPDRTRYTASGRVDGWLLGRWGMSEYDGLLRVATTRGPEGPAKQTDSAVTVLRERGGRLDVVGAVGGLGQAERIRAVRWFGDLAVVVTFRQIDPLYTVDLSDPEKPAVVGQLKVPGYSGYLHPVGGGLLLAVGQGATSDGRVLGARLSSFDLSDLAAPKRQDVLDLRGSWSPVEDDARAFTYLPEPRLAVVPVEDALRAARIEPDGSLTLTGRWRLPGSVPERAVPVAGGRLAVLAGGPERTLTLVDAATLRPLAPPLGLDHRSGSGHTVPPWPSPCSVPRTQCPR